MCQPSGSSLRIACRIARRIHDAVLRGHHRRQRQTEETYLPLSAPIARWQRVTRLIAQAQQRQWSSALARLSHERAMIVSEIQHELSTARRNTAERKESVVASMRDIASDLAQLKDEFGNWKFDGKSGSLSVTTESIILEEIELGSFVIHLAIPKLASANDQRVYTVEALEPNPAEGSSHVTHPHVSDELLCEGDASSAIKRALNQGHIADFFMLVRSVLTTYNAGSPYVALDRWHGGTPCHDCGDHMSDDDRSRCERCDHEFCSSCTTCCEDCQSFFCGECMVKCPCCDEAYCGNCISVCALCHTSTCEGCLDEGACTTCRERNQNDSDDEDENGDGEDHRLPSAAEEEESPGAGADPAIHAVCLGEATRLP